ncbi:PQQ-dependent sugar dehydrogenase [Pedobacter nyackensis]|uniref:Cytochrome c n=1 Tax=Pedobacter nyackensis TaxID=475255 RepID=A0A1W2EVM0_9SPHI|nr:PQQ-dependent sugar dehydrogenase [Pedobacter nyackensis]SMD13266.1 cytochrome c [Pedobacter nyackensis]
MKLFASSFIALAVLGTVCLAYVYKEKIALKLMPELNQGRAAGIPPDSSRFSHMTLVSGLDEPMGMAILPNYDLVVIERKGAVRYFNNHSKELLQIAQFSVFSGIEDGLLGVAADPQFEKNNWIYFYYAVSGDKNINHLVRFELRDQKILQSSKKVLLEIPTQRTYCCHSAGHITFGSDGLLYLSIGDNTNAEEIEGHNPTDERPGRELSDGQASTANSNDFRGKILRIKPKADGTYSIPDGNLFPKDGSLGKPEIYIMGVRNPFRISVDPKTQYLYWGDVGPDTEVKAKEGKLSYDEINQARKPGFFGYPYFLGENEAFPDYDFATKKEGPPKDPLHPINDSPNNTGIRELPPAQPAFIWYGKGPSTKWPALGSGGASAMAGPVYYNDLYPNAPYKLPDYYNGKLFIFDWVRKWILAVTMDKEGNYVGIEPFFPQLQVIAPIDMQIAPDGAIYLIAYGTNWFARNTDSGIIRIEYTEGNRNPLAVIKVDQTIGAAPFDVALSAIGSRDYDAGDRLAYEWKIDNKKFSEKEIRHTFLKSGKYNILLKVSDQYGGIGTATVQVKVGNTPPKVAIESKANRSFYWDNSLLDYQVKISDREDGTIDPERTKINFTYIPAGNDLATALSGKEDSDLQYASIVKLYTSLDCKACHTTETKSIGPSLKDIARRYKGRNGADEMLAHKIISGGSGSWGSYPMPPHANLTDAEARKIAGYILSLGEKQKNTPLANRIYLTEHKGKGTEGAYVLQASYTDKGANGIGPIATSSRMVLRNALVQLEDYHEGNISVMIASLKTGYVTYVANITHGKYARFNAIDLNHVKWIRFRVREEGIGGKIEIRQNAKDGLLVAEVKIAGGEIKDLRTGWKEVLLPVVYTDKVSGVKDLFLMFKNDQTNKPLFHIDWIKFEK